MSAHIWSVLPALAVALAGARHIHTHRRCTDRACRSGSRRCPEYSRGRGMEVSRWT